MTVSPFQLNELTHLHNRLAMLRPSSLDEEQAEPEDVVRISAEAKKQQIYDQTRTEVLHRIRKT